MKKTFICFLFVWLAISCAACNAPPSATVTTTATLSLTITPTTSYIPTTTPASTTPPATTTISIPPITTPAPITDPLVKFMLDRINSDRTQNGLTPVSLGNNSAAQNHAEDMFTNFYLSHWDIDGLKPYMRYTFAGGINAEGENSAYYGWYDKSDDAHRYVTIDPQQILAELQDQMMYDDAASNWGHRDNILNKWHKKVNLGIAYDDHRLTLVQQFEGGYISFTQPPALVNGILTARGRISLGVIDSVTVYYDAPLRTMTQAELVSGPSYYTMGNRIATVVPPPPPGYAYSGLPENTVQAGTWEVDEAGSFSVQADINTMTSTKGSGVYTVVFRSKSGDENISLTNYSVILP